MKYEKSLYKKGFKLIVGLDEVGRGAWAGPIVAGCVCIPRDLKLSKADKTLLNQIKDSKKITPKKREELYNFITNNFIWSTGEVSAKEIDKINIGEANKLAFRKAIKKINLEPDYILVDYFSDIGLDDYNIVVKGIKFGDNKVLSIAAASIVAKVYRDKKMVRLAKKFPTYSFEKHKGYGTKLHRDSLAKSGVCKIHRTSYKPVANLLY